MALFAIADTHLSLSVEKPMDIFGGWNDYVARLEKNWRAVVGENDTVVIPGDVSWAMSLEQAQADFAFLDSLPGRKLLMKGNHDYWWSTKKKADEFFQKNGFSTLNILHNNTYTEGSIAVCGTRGWFFDAEEDADRKVLLREAGRLEASILAAKETGLEPVVFLHYPPVTLTQRCDVICEVLERHGIKRCYYGHLHSYSHTSSVNGELGGIKYALISSDFLSFCPAPVYENR